MEKPSDKNEIIAEAIGELSRSIIYLGNGNSTGSGGFGAIEGLAMLIRDSNQELASSIGGISSALENIAESNNNISESNNNIADEIKNLAESISCKCHTEKTEIESNEYKN